MAIDLPWALALVVMSGLIPALKTIENSTVSPSGNSSKYPTQIICYENSELRLSDIKLVEVEQGMKECYVNNLEWGEICPR
ncbi:hypothetical protein PL11201_300002 [Planktothrix sp. PCC 11201]|uniref:hypothetical protein n=1 Tax=Planktothrix sp. PCC 11201 TaxID=1729650 RepID=UPI000911439A|nr:hypothetical protein [Planktothrix sp. PCC 11201]SKB12156.1 hypothetical protein PL11201_300002 [Planktothrix sp. PCC 11201]